MARPWSSLLRRQHQVVHSRKNCRVRGVETLERREMLSVSAMDGLDDLAVAAIEGGKGGTDLAAHSSAVASDHYTYESMKQQLHSLEDTYPGLCDVVRIGDAVKTYDPSRSDPAYNSADLRDIETHRGLWAIKISQGVNAAVNDERKPDLKYIGSIHGNEPLGMEMCMRFAQELLGHYSEHQSFVNNNEIWILPLMNPDGFAAGQRTNANGYDLNRNFPELANKVNPDDPVDSKPTLASLESQLPAKKGVCQVPEVKAVMEWSTNYPAHFELAANFHTGAVLVNYPYDNPNDLAHPQSPDDGLYRQLADLYADPYNLAYPPTTMTTTLGADWYVIGGGMQDFDYRYFDTKHVTVELYNGYGYGTKSNPLDLAKQWDYNREPMLSYLEKGIGLVLAGKASGKLAPHVSAETRIAPAPAVVLADTTAAAAALATDPTAPATGAPLVERLLTQRRTKILAQDVLFEAIGQSVPAR